MSERTDNPIADFNRHDAKESRWLKSLPKCVHCKEPIQEEKYYSFDEGFVHHECLRDFCDEHYQNTFEYEGD